MEKSAHGHVLHRTALLIGVAALCSAAGASAEVAQVPLSLGGSVEPNIMLVVDDSGSMDEEVLFPTPEGALFGGNDDPMVVVDTTSETFAYNRGGSYFFDYLFDTGTGAGNMMYADPIVPPLPEFGFARSAAFNGQYYDPAVAYLPWLNRGDANGQPYANADPTSAMSDPTVAASARVNLTANLSLTVRVPRGFPFPDGGINAGNNTTRTITYYPAFYYAPVSADVDLPELEAYQAGKDYNCSVPLPSAYHHFYRNRSAVQSALEARGVDAIAPDGRCLAKIEIRSGNTMPSGRTWEQELQNFANWFQYHRKRHLALRAGMGQAFDAIGGVRVGGFTINDRDDVTMWDLDDEAADIYDFFYGIKGRVGSTPNRQALRFAGEQFDGNDGVIEHSCQQNFALMFTDGLNNGTVSGIGNADGGEGAPYEDEYSNTIADIAMHYYETRLRDGLDAGEVPVPAACAAADPPAWLDCNTDLHMRTYGITLGGSGTVYGVTHDSVADAYASPPTWPAAATNSSPEHLDDMYHATVNGRGQMLSARSTNELTATLRAALAAIMGDVVSSASSVSSNSTRLDADTLVYQARFDSRRWSGELLAFSLTGDGELDDAEWDAGDLIPAPGSRAIYTRNAAGNGIAFAWDALDPAQQAALNRNAAGVTDGRGTERLAYLRGSRADEGANGGTFRTRDGVLGDIVNSSPWFVGAQNFGYERLPSGAGGRDSYQAFRLANESRRKMLYVGANDGMLHAFDAETGIERFAFVPSELIGALPALTSPDYTHRYYVDGAPVAGDAYIDGAWKTILVGTTGAGGRSVFALDVTDPDSLGAASVKWEFTDADLGNVIGRPSITRMSNGRWAAIFGSGYGLSKSAKLFIVDLADGTLLAKISTVRSATEPTAAANGMGQPFPADVDGDAIADVIYAGDLFGNMWKFEVDGAINTWASDYSGGSPASPRPLITVCGSGDVAGPFDCPAAQRQPITMRPVVGRGPDGGLAVYFGTGKFFETGDNAVIGVGPVQSFYGVYDDNTTGGSDGSDRIAGRSELVEQEIVAEVEFDDDDHVRATSQNPVGADDRGWYLDLVSPVLGFQGERAVAQPLLREGRLIFTTLIPSGDPCEGGGSSWLMELSALDGGRFDYPVFDLDGDGGFTDADMITITDADGNEILVAPSGRRSGVGVIQTPAIIEAGEVEYKVSGGSSGGVESVRERGRLSKGRNSWRQLWPGR